jgi:hypothetical protein
MAFLDETFVSSAYPLRGNAGRADPTSQRGAPSAPSAGARRYGLAASRGRVGSTMSHQETELPATILRLTVPVRAQFAHEILASLDDTAEAGAGERWLAEVARRADEVLAGTAEMEDADAVHEQLTARLRNLPGAG